jgi:hypothetical protein
MTGGTIPAGSVTNPGTCTITVQVTAPADATTATFTNTIPVNSLVTNQGVTNILPASANVQVYTAGQGITANKAFSPDTINVGDNSRLRFNFTAPADTALTNFSFTDNLPAGVIISNSQGPTISSGCGARQLDGCNRDECHYINECHHQRGSTVPGAGLGDQQHAGDGHQHHAAGKYYQRPGSSAS